MGVQERWKERVRDFKAEVLAVELACKDHRVPWFARLFAACVVGYAFSPIDLIPDFIPVIGYLDDLVLVPLGIALALKMIPPTVMEECRVKAYAAVDEGRPTIWVAACATITLWIFLATFAVVFMLRNTKR